MKIEKVPNKIDDIQKGLIDGDYSIIDLVDYYINKIEINNSKLNALITVTKNYAYDRAVYLQKEYEKERNNILSRYPLFGMMVTHKDLFLTKGIRTTAGSKVLENYIPEYNSTVVERLEDAGCILLGKANCDAWAHGSSGENSDFGPTLNPWDREYVPGGSSSGSGCCVGAQFSLISTGTDTCGSVRLPANYCGVYGLKPTYGVLSRYGVIAMASSLDTVGILGLTSHDINKVFNLIKGEDGIDATLLDTPKNKFNDKKIRIGYPKEFFQEGLNSEVRENIEKVVKIFKEMKYEIIEVSMPSTKYAIDVYYVIQPAEVSSNLARYDGIRYGFSRSCFGDEAKRRILLGNYVLSAGYNDEYYKKAMKVRTVIIKEVQDAFENADVLIAPVAPTPPFRLGKKTNNPLEMYLTDIYAATANLTGIPSLAVPYGFSLNNLPLGYQLMTNSLNEEVLFRLAGRFEKYVDYEPKIADIK